MKASYARDVSPARVRALLADRSVEQVAADLDLDEEDVERIAADGVDRRPTIQVVCNLSGRHFTARSWRAAYRRAQIEGFADWDWWVALTGGAQ